MYGYTGILSRDSAVGLIMAQGMVPVINSCLYAVPDGYISCTVVMYNVLLV